MKLNTENIDLGINNKSKNKKLSKQTVLLIGVVVLFILTIVFVFNLEDETKINDVNNANNSTIKNNEVSKFDTNKINAVATAEQIKTPLPIQTQEQEQEQNSKFDMDKINAAQNQANSVQAEENQNIKVLEEFNSTLEENQDLKARIEFLERENQNLRMQKTEKNQSNQSKDEDKNIQNEMKIYLNKIKSEIKVNGHSFHFAGKNYYVGDKIDNYEIRDIQKSNIRTCNKDWCYTLFF